MQEQTSAASVPVHIPDSEKLEIKEGFKERYSRLTDWDEFIKYSLSFLRRCIRVNTIKISIDEVKKRIGKDWILTPIPWCKEGFWIAHHEGRRDIGNTIEHSLGYIYVQEAASMLPPLALDPKPGEVVLDMCASPGSKASQIAQMMQNKGVLVANDYQGKRLSPLGINMQRTGITNEVITLNRGEFIRGLEFDKILLDAPCSGSGTIRKSLKTLRIWNPKMITKIASQQKQLIKNAFSLLKRGGTLVYSTCSLEPEEDEGVVDFLLSICPDAQLEEIKLDIKRSAAVLEFEGEKYNPEVSKCLRIWPQDNDTEGFFVAKISKK